ncbi:hypothetical protein GGX14DRAFT_607822 [Mycena pura]|uniref:Uncharacterized protein n=1 Tax=Mycena pura TaxID=153505 RepID=A0AAD6UL37_9AGAR|nr:hypothetical protein GGX14DRAFT_607822 [Mycena pura]
MVDVQAHTARLVALFVSCVLYGILLTTFVPCLHSLLFFASHKFQIKSRHEIKFPILAATILMFLVASFSAVISMQDVMDGFINYQGPGGPLEFYGTVHTVNAGWIHWMPVVEDSVQAILGDGLLVSAWFFITILGSLIPNLEIYRCYVLYDRNWRAIIVPSMVWIGLVAMSITSSYREITLTGGESLNDSAVLPVLSAASLLTFATSLITTYLIIRRLIKTEFRLNKGVAIQRHILTRIATIFFETGLIYTLSIIASLGVYLAGSSLDYVASLACSRPHGKWAANDVHVGANSGSCGTGEAWHEAAARLWILSKISGTSCTLQTQAYVGFRHIVLLSGEIRHHASGSLARDAT